MSSKIVFQTNAQGLYVGPVEALASPQEPGGYLIPAGCIDVPPATHIPALKAACWNSKAWQLLDYFNGLIVYSTRTRRPLTLTGVGPIPHGYTLQRPGPDQQWVKGRWVDDLSTQLAKLQALKLALIDEGYAAFIAAGFSCAALGYVHHYNNALKDQVNLTDLVQSGLPGRLACGNKHGAKLLLWHSTEQLQAVQHDRMRFKQQALRQAEHLKNVLAQALSAQDLPAVKRMEWKKPD
jgi:hypothetical protein